MIGIGRGFAVRVLPVAHRVRDAFAFVLQHRDRLVS